MQNRQDINILDKEQFDARGRDHMYRLLIENMSEGALVMGKNGIVVYSNKYFADLTGFQLERIIGSNFRSMLSETDKTKFAVCLNAEKERSYCQINLNSKKDRLAVLVSVTPYSIDNETYFIVIVSDITAQKNTEMGLENKVSEHTLEFSAANRRLSQMNEELQEINDYLDNFVHAIAHDLRTPVANLKLIEKMFEIAPEEEKPKLFNQVRANIGVLDSTLKGLVQIIEAYDRKEINQPDIDVIAIVKEVLKNKEDQIKENNAYVEIDKKTDDKINHVEGYIRSIANNMISNALKYSKPGHQPEIQISFERIKNNLYRLSFRDKGIGMDLSKNRENLFKPFQQFSSNQKGMGIGLHLVNNMVRKNGGYIDVESKPQEGTIFNIYLKEYNE